jgi:hypothetical protein
MAEAEGPLKVRWATAPGSPKGPAAAAAAAVKEAAPIQAPAAAPAAAAGLLAVAESVALPATAPASVAQPLPLPTAPTRKAAPTANSRKAIVAGGRRPAHGRRERPKGPLHPDFPWDRQPPSVVAARMAPSPLPPNSPKATQANGAASGGAVRPHGFRDADAMRALMQRTLSTYYGDAAAPYTARPFGVGLEATGLEIERLLFAGHWREYASDSMEAARDHALALGTALAAAGGSRLHSSSWALSAAARFIGRSDAAANGHGHAHAPAAAAVGVRGSPSAVPPPVYGHSLVGSPPQPQQSDEPVGPVPDAPAAADALAPNLKTPIAPATASASAAAAALVDGPLPLDPDEREHALAERRAAAVREETRALEAARVKHLRMLQLYLSHSSFHEQQQKAAIDAAAAANPKSPAHAAGSSPKAGGGAGGSADDGPFGWKNRFAAKMDEIRRFLHKDRTHVTAHTATGATAAAADGSQSERKHGHGHGHSYGVSNSTGKGEKAGAVSKKVLHPSLVRALDELRTHMADLRRQRSERVAAVQDALGKGRTPNDPAVVEDSAAPPSPKRNASDVAAAYDAGGTAAAASALSTAAAHDDDDDGFHPDEDDVRLNPRLRAAYQDQGDPNMATPAALRARQALRLHPDVHMVIERFWATYHKDAKLGVARDEYVSVHIRLQKVLRGQAAGWSVESARQAALYDWNRDTRGKVVHLDRRALYHSIFEVADVWCESLDPREYCQFLNAVCHGRSAHTRAHSTRRLARCVSTACTPPPLT